MEAEERDLLAALRAFDVLLGAGVGLELHEEDMVQ